MTGGIGFVRGLTDAAGTPVNTVVEVSGLPFATLGVDGRYATIGRAGNVTVRARAANTSLAGEANATVVTGADATVDIALAGEVTEATVVPADGAITVSPGAQVEVSSSVPIKPGSLTTAAITFTQITAPSAPVPFRLVLSGSGRTLAIVPLARLAEGTEFSVAVSGLADAVGGAITVPQTTFTTQSNTAPQYDLDLLVFSFPNAEGQVTLSGPPGTLAPGSTVLVVNETTGEVSTLPVFNDGSVGGDLVAENSDRLIVTITDLIGRQTSFKRSEYVAPDGTTAVGNGGGEILGPGGVEVRIPEDAVMNGVAAILKIVALQLASVRWACNVGDGAAAGGRDAPSATRSPVRRA
ncbi:MAG: Ig-like domain-containing protein [Acidobacteriota bacterium]|nr:Ig-like domain-containing protein [Acidobacteriota bacterium]